MNIKPVTIRKKDNINIEKSKELYDKILKEEHVPADISDYFTSVS